MLYMVTWIPSIYPQYPPMLAYIPAPWILWDIIKSCVFFYEKKHNSFLSPSEVGTQRLHVPF